MPGGSVVTTLTQKRAVFPAFSSHEVTAGQMRKIGIHFIIHRMAGQFSRGKGIRKQTVGLLRNNDIVHAIR